MKWSNILCSLFWQVIRVYRTCDHFARGVLRLMLHFGQGLGLVECIAVIGMYMMLGNFNSSLALEMYESFLHLSYDSWHKTILSKLRAMCNKGHIESLKRGPSQSLGKSNNFDKIDSSCVFSPIHEGWRHHTLIVPAAIFAHGLPACHRVIRTGEVWQNSAMSDVKPEPSDHCFHH